MGLVIKKKKQGLLLFIKMVIDNMLCFTLEKKEIKAFMTGSQFYSKCETKRLMLAV